MSFIFVSAPMGMLKNKLIEMKYTTTSTIIPVAMGKRHPDSLE